MMLCRHTLKGGVLHLCTKHSPIHSHNSKGPCFCCPAITPHHFIDRSIEGQYQLQRPYQMFFCFINHFNASILFCLSFFASAVLTLYFLYFLHWSEDTSTSVYHAFSSLCYFTPILGAAIADSWLGKFK